MPETSSCHDPLDCLREHGWRLSWLPDFDDRVIIIDDKRVIVADPNLNRDRICARLRRAIPSLRPELP